MKMTGIRMLILLLATGPVGAALGATLNRGLGPEPDALDIHQAQGLAAMQVLRDLNEGLVTFDAKGELVPGTAESWDISSDRLTYVFQLRKDAVWSDGAPVTAMDFLRGWQRALAPPTQARTAGLLEMIDGASAIMAGRASGGALGVTVQSPYRLEVRLARATPWFLEVLAHPVTYPLPEAGGEIAAERPVNGAFVLTEQVPRSHLRIERNPRFHAADEVRLTAVNYITVEDPGAELSRYRAGELHITETIPPGRFEWLQANLPGQLRIAPYMGSFWLGLNLSREPLAGAADLRRALSLAVDRATLTRVVLGAGEKPAWGIVPPGLNGFVAPEDPASTLQQQARHERAKRLYRRAGYGPDRPLRLELRFNTSTQHRRMAVAVAAMWKQVLGVHTELVHEEWKVFVNNRRQGVRTQVFRGGWIADFADPVSFLDLFRSDNELDNTFYRNPDYDQLLERAGTLTGAQRMALLAQAETLLLRDTPVIPLYTYVSRHLVSPRVSGYEDNPRDVHLSRYLDLSAP